MSVNADQPTLHEALKDLARDLVDSGWRYKRKRDWTREERAAYQRWSKQEREREAAEGRARGEPATFVVLTYEEARALDRWEAEHDEPPHAPEPFRFTLEFDRAVEMPHDD